MTIASRTAGCSIRLAAALALLAGCEPAQTLDGSARGADQTAWAASDTAKPAYTAAGWKRGDKLAWEEQIRKRNQAQNDYVR